MKMACWEARKKLVFQGLSKHVAVYQAVQILRERILRTPMGLMKGASQAASLKIRILDHLPKRSTDMGCLVEQTKVE